jgi:hypothetical protein
LALRLNHHDGGSDAIISCAKLGRQCAGNLYPMSASQRDELAPSYVEHGSSSRNRSVYRTLSLPQSRGQVLGTELNCSELRPGPARQQMVDDLPQRVPVRSFGPKPVTTQLTKGRLQKIEFPRSFDSVSAGFRPLEAQIRHRARRGT